MAAAAAAAAATAAAAGRMRGARLVAADGARRERREQLRDLAGGALRAGDERAVARDELLEAVLARAACVLVDRHARIVSRCVGPSSPCRDVARGYTAARTPSTGGVPLSYADPIAIAHARGRGTHAARAGGGARRPRRRRARAHDGRAARRPPRTAARRARAPPRLSSCPSSSIRRSSARARTSTAIRATRRPTSPSPQPRAPTSCSRRVPRSMYPGRLRRRHVDPGPLADELEGRAAPGPLPRRRDGRDAPLRARAAAARVLRREGLPAARDRARGGARPRARRRGRRRADRARRRRPRALLAQPLPLGGRAASARPRCSPGCAPPGALYAAGERDAGSCWRHRAHAGSPSSPTTSSCAGATTSAPYDPARPGHPARRRPRSARRA